MNDILTYTEAKKNAGLWASQITSSNATRAEERERMKEVHAFRHPPRFKFNIKKAE